MKPRSFFLVVRMVDRKEEWTWGGEWESSRTSARANAKGMNDGSEPGERFVVREVYEAPVAKKNPITSPRKT